MSEQLHNPNQSPGLDPQIAAVAQDPTHMIPLDERRAALKAAHQAAHHSARQNRLAIPDSAGDLHWGAEYGVLPFDRFLRGGFEDTSAVPSSAVDIASMAGADKVKGTLSHVLVETDAGEHVMIRRTSGEERSAQKQTFDMLSTRMVAGKGDEKVPPRPIDTNQLKGIVVAEGLPLKLAPDHEGRIKQTEGNVIKITGVDISAEGRVGTHRIRNEPERHRDMRGEFYEALNKSRAESVAPAAGSIALKNSVQS